MLFNNNFKSDWFKLFFSFIFNDALSLHKFYLEMIMTEPENT